MLARLGRLGSAGWVQPGAARESIREKLFGPSVGTLGDPILSVKHERHTSGSLLTLLLPQLALPLLWSEERVRRLRGT